MKKKIIALILCICLISCTCIQPAYAMGAEGIIVGGGAAAAGVTLTMPQVALLVAAGFGLVYATQHAEEIYRGLDTALTNAANNIEGGIEQLTVWNEQAAQGEIAIASAPIWILDSIKGWIASLYDNAGSPAYSETFVGETTANSLILGSDYWNNSKVRAPVDGIVCRVGRIRETEISTDLTSYMFVVSTKDFDMSAKFLVNGTYYYVKTWTSSLSIPIGQTIAGNNKIAYDAINALPRYEDVIAVGTGNTFWQKAIAAYTSGFFDEYNNLNSSTGSICPDETVGGIKGALDVGGIDNINVPDLDIGGSGLLAPDNVGTGSIDDVLNDVLTRLKQQELSWSDYMSDVAVGNPSITIEGKDYVIDDTGVTDIPVEDVVPDNPPADGVVVPEGLEPFTMSLTDFFPFCIPFDIVDFVNVLCAEPEAPRFNWTFTWYGGATDTLTIDLKPFDGVAQLLRNMELLLFCIGLAMITRNQIRG